MTQGSLLFALAAAVPIVAGVAPATAPALFDGNKVWSVHLKFTEQQWAALEPAAGRGPGFGLEMSPAGMFTPAFLKGDTDGDGTLSKREFLQLAANWFASWGQSKEGLTVGQLRGGLETLLPAPAGFGGPGGPEPGAGGPGGRGPRFVAREGARNGMSGAMGIDFQYVRADLEFDDQNFSGVAVRYKGNNTFQMSRNSNKKSFKIELNKYDKKLKFAGQTTINLHNNVTDASWMNETLSYQVFRDAGVPSPRTSFARVYVSVPGKYEKAYFGLYSVVENIDKNFAKDRYRTNEGAIYKPVGRELFGYLGDDWSRYEQMYDPKTTLTKAQKARVMEFAKLVTSAGDEEFRAKAGEFVDIEEFARFLAATVMLSNMDSILAMGQNFYVYLHPESNKFQFLPWDLDHSFGHFPMAGGDGTQLSIDQPWQGQNRFLERVFAVKEFQKQYRARLQELNARLYAKDRIAKQVDETAALIRPAVAAESEAKLQRFERAISGAGGGIERPPAGERGFRGGPPVGFGGAMAGLSIKGFVTGRAQSISDQLAGKQVAERTSGRRGPGGFGPPGMGPGGFGPARMLERGFLTAFGVKDDETISRERFVGAFERWFHAWNTDGSGLLTEEQIRAGVEKDLAPRMPGGRGFPVPPQE